MPKLPKIPTDPLAAAAAAQAQRDRAGQMMHVALETTMRQPAEILEVRVCKAQLEFDPAGRPVLCIAKPSGQRIDVNITDEDLRRIAGTYSQKLAAANGQKDAPRDGAQAQSGA